MVQKQSFIGREQIPVCICGIVCGCFQTVAEAEMAKPKISTVWPPVEKVCQPLFSVPVGFHDNGNKLFNTIDTY